ncbi:hypothetical protein DMH17_11750 [Raoultella planticola]|nr:hypothetical protein [Raoultella planticola]
MESTRRAILTGWIDENTRFATGDFARQKRASPDNLPHNLPLVEHWKSRRQEKCRAGTDCAGMALARKPWIVPIPGTTNKDHMRQKTQRLAACR